jgi:hypothetical protein
VTGAEPGADDEAGDPAASCGRRFLYTPSNSMRLTARALPLAALLAAALGSAARAQTPPETPAPAATEPSAARAAPVPTPTPDAVALPLPTPIAPTVLRIRETPSIAAEKLSANNPYGKTSEAPAAIPPKLTFADATLSTGFFVSVHVDPTGRALTVRRERDPIPSLVAESLKSFSRWVFSPGRRGGQAVDTWGAYRVDLEVSIRSPKIVQMAFTPVPPTAPLPKPFEWPTDAAWLESRKAAPPADGSIPIDQVDTTPIPQKTPWSADSYKGPFSVKYWVRVDKTGKIDKAIPLDVSDPVLLPYFRRAMSAWVIRPAQSAGAPVDSWNELTLGGTVSYSDEIKQIIALKRPIGQ